MDPEYATLTVHRHPLPIGQTAHRSIDVDDGWNPVLASENGSVRQHAAQLEDDTCDVLKERCPARVDGARDQDVAWLNTVAVSDTANNANGSSGSTAGDSQPLQPLRRSAPEGGLVVSKNERRRVMERVTRLLGLSLSEELGKARNGLSKRERPHLRPGEQSDLACVLE